MDFFDAGFIDTLFKISASTEKAKMRASCFALDILVWILLCITQDDFFTHICMRAFDEGGVDHFLRIIARGIFGWQGPLAMRCLHKLIMPPSCAERLTALQVSRIIQLCSKICLNGLQTTVGRSDAYNSAQYFGLFLNTQDLNTRVDQLVAWRSDIMHEAAEACQWCLNRRLTPISRQFSLQVLRHNPEITDNLLQTASTPRSRTDFSTNSDCPAAHTLLYLTMLPPGVIPETEFQVSDEDSAELQAALKCIQILYSHPHAVTMIIGMRSKLNDEDLDMLHR
ncbi:hypothetical protein FRC03_003649 [Tulasnella sp. 419]|nr:hypothetical protein FRC03_003649 [Tulasnella sp. 419]